MKKTSALFLLAACAWTFAAAETVEGVLEKSAPYSALFSASPESGDLIGYPFKNHLRSARPFWPAACPACSARSAKPLCAIWTTPKR